MMIEDAFPGPKLVNFEAARAKLTRARKHISELEQVIADHIPNNPIQFGPTSHSADGIVTMPFTTPPFPKDAPVILGDIIHNARVSLDLMASELARNNNQSDKGVYFPFSEDRDSLPASIAQKKFNRCGAKAMALLKEFKPYRGGNLELRELHDLDIMDKHKSLIPDPNIDHHPKIDIEKWTYLPGSEFEYQFTFPNDSLLKGRELISGSTALVELCERILKAFETL